jgi:FAD/FMN-containing dehydrogenase
MKMKKNKENNEIIISTNLMNEIEFIDDNKVKVGAGVVLEDLIQVSI